MAEGEHEAPRWQPDGAPAPRDPFHVALEAQSDLEAERSVLGACLVDPNVYDVHGHTLRADGGDFRLPAHAEVWRAVAALRARREPVDLVTLAGELRARERLNTVGGVQYLGELTDTIPTVAHFERHARRLAELARVRSALWCAHEALELAREGRAPTAVTEPLGRALEVLREDSAEGEVSQADALSAALDQLLDGVPQQGVAPPWPEVRALVPLLRPGELVVLAGRPGTGKSALALALALEAARSGQVLFATLEMSPVEIMQRALAQRSGVPLGAILARDLSGTRPQEIHAAAQELHPLPVRWLLDPVTVRSIEARARSLLATAPVALVVVDYLQLMQGDGDSREQEIAGITRGLKRLAMTLGVPVLALSQLNRKSEARANKRPELSDLRESGAIEQDANAVLLLYRASDDGALPPPRGPCELIVAKQRNGATGTALLTFDGPRVRHESAAPTPTREEAPAEPGFGWEGGQEQEEAW